MQCEMCGKNISGPSHRVIVEGTELNVCPGCAKYGHEVKPVRAYTPPSAPPGITIRTRSQSQSQPRSRQRRRPDMFDQMTDELVDDCGMVIRRAREARGMSQEDLARKIQEKASLLKKIERNDLTPDDSVRKKLERTLGISLTETIE